eukprot:c20077_g2_i1 orf=228-452(+)
MSIMVVREGPALSGYKSVFMRAQAMANFSNKMHRQESDDSKSCYSTNTSLTITPMLHSSISWLQSCLHLLACQQ